MFRVTDKGARKLAQYGKSFGKGAAFTVGVHEKQGAKNYRDSAATIAEIATINEFGLGVPERSFIRDWFTENQTMIEEDFRAATAAVFRGKMTFEKAAHILGSKYVALIQQRIIAGISPPNAPSTVAAKGSSTPLIDTGILKASIKYQLINISARAGRE